MVSSPGQAGGGNEMPEPLTNVFSRQFVSEMS